jgi:4-hydroxybenzoate polyprenyltransferase
MGKEFVVSNMISRKAALTMTFLTLLIGLVSAWISSAFLFAFTLVAAFLGTLYSVPPFRLKMRYPFSTLIQFVGCFLPFLAGATSVNTVTLQTIIISSLFAILTVIHRLVHEIQNYKVDLQTGKETVAVVKGLRTAETLLKLAVLVGVSEFAVFFVLGWFSIFFVSIFLLYMFITILAPLWLRYIHQSPKIIILPITQFSSFILLLIVLVYYGKF